MIASSTVLARRDPKPYRIVVKIKNNRLWTAIQEIYPGTNQRQAADQLGIGQGHLGHYLNMKIFPYKYKKRMGGFWTHASRRVADRLGHPVEYLFDPILYGRKPLPYLELEIDPRDIPALNLVSLPPAPDEALDHAGLRSAVQTALLKGLTKREYSVLSDLYGLNGDPHTLEEIGCHMDVTRERVRQIWNKAIRKMRHPTRSRALREYY